MDMICKTLDLIWRFQNLASIQSGIDRLDLLRVVRCLPLNAGLQDATKLEGQASDKPRGRKPRDTQWRVSIGDSLWGLEWWVCL
jgi:hypothetical protein